MRTFSLISMGASAGLLMLAACTTVPEPIPDTVEVIVPPMQTCTPISALTRVTVPAKTETYYAITEIDNPPYEPIQSKQKMTRVIEEARTIFVNSQGAEVTDICDMEINPNGMTSPSGS